MKPSTSVRKLPSAAGVSLKREAASVPSGLGLVLKKPRIASQTFTPLGRAIEADRRASPTTQVYLYEEIAAEGLMCCVFELPCFLRDCLANNSTCIVIVYVVFSNFLLNFTHVHTHTPTHPFNGFFSGTTQVSRYQKGKTNLDFTEARDSGWQWHQLGHNASLQLAPDRQPHQHPTTLMCCKGIIA